MCLKEYHFDVSYGYFSGDCHERFSILVNGMNPGPEIRVKPGEEVVVHVKNNMPAESTSIHWHGQFQRGSPWMDGTPYVTQCPIAPMDTFTYRFHANDEPGTHWWHSHTVGQKSMGAAGLFIIEAPDGEQEPFAYDEEMPLVLHEWYHKGYQELVHGLMSAPFQWAGNAESILVNGKSKDFCMENATVTDLDVSVCEACPYEVIEVEQGKTYRLRVANFGPLMMLSMGIDDHPLTIVEAEGHYTQPKTVNALEINVAARYSVLLKADQPIGSYWGRLEIRHRNADLWGHFIVRYKGAPVEDPPSSHWTATNSSNLTEGFVVKGVLPEIDQHVNERWSMDNRDEVVGLANHTEAPPPADRLIYVNGTHWKENDHVVWKINGDMLKLPDAPLLWLSKADALTEEDRRMSNIVDVKLGEVIDLAIHNSYAINGISEQHPWHSHGYDFWVLGHGYGSYDAAKDETNLNTVNPIKRDTATLLPARVVEGEPQDVEGWVVVRMKFDNPGMWLFHCHIDWHLAMGMGFTFSVQPELVQPPPKEFDMCGRLPELFAADEADGVGVSETEAGKGVDVENGHGDEVVSALATSGACPGGQKCLRDAALIWGGLIVTVTALLRAV
ncbi:unnamed protein product [Vitrella brassicaformis CCMP3155]|uniref:L-ascorbate oxidase n=2 Tax=Vitrella brassicaformis TaxID=1169539 RepID=A0A0G4EZY0_VITBC|nr:unnamed protein product [Vitrella brassicaformis CCMP3155]|eukprot:CEM04768.1 unnamed protein product [Vitrella brassicaformis CCMP3155]